MRELKGKKLTVGKQHYLGVNLTKREIFNCTWPEMVSHYFMEDGDMKILLGIIAPGQPWYGDKLVWPGCYYEKNTKFLTEEELEEGMNIFYYSRAHYERIIKERLQLPEFAHYYEGIATSVICVCNHDLKEYCMLTDLPESIIDSMRICPLPLLLAAIPSNECFDGDYDTDDETQSFVGRWAGHSVSSEYDIPEGYTEIKPGFWEDPEEEYRD